MDTLDMVHSLLRYLLLVLLVVNVGSTLHGMFSKRQFSNVDDKLSLALFITTHLQLTIGLILYFMYTSSIGAFKDMHTTMQNPMLRYYTVEHITGMLGAIVLISLGRILAKKATDSEVKFKRSFTYFTLGLLVIVAMLMHMPK